MKKYLKLLTFIPALFMMYIIWGFSASTADESSSLSLKVTTDIVETYDKVTFNKTYSDKQKQKIIDMLHTPVRKMAHMSEYAILCILIILPLSLYNISNKKKYIFTLLTCLIYASSDEFHQLFITERAGRISDVFIDLTGASIGLVIFIILKKIVKFY